MAFVPPGILFAGTPPNRVPRIPDEEMAGEPVEIGGFYIDILPWPNEPNAIATTNVTRDEAEQLCASKSKRLCTELEWERACKGPENTTYEYGDQYRKDVCATGIALEHASRRPTGELAQCKSRFGVSEMHGSAFEWTSSAWGRSSKTDASQGVLRGGNSVAGELVGRCSNAIARNPSKKSPTMGFRCCAGAKNTAEVKLELQGTPGLSITSASKASPWGFQLAHAARRSMDDDVFIDEKTLRAWTWTPTANEELIIAEGCTTPPRQCAILVARSAPTKEGAAGTNVNLTNQPLISAPSGKDLAEIARNGDPRHLRVRALDERGIYSREITYAYGRIDLGDPKRP